MTISHLSIISCYFRRWQKIINNFNCKSKRNYNKLNYETRFIHNLKTKVRPFAYSVFFEGIFFAPIFRPLLVFGVAYINEKTSFISLKIVYLRYFIYVRPHLVMVFWPRWAKSLRIICEYCLENFGVSRVNFETFHKE